MAKATKEEVAAKVQECVAKYGRAPHLAVILVGEDPASQSYVKSKGKDAEQCGFRSTTLRLPESTTEEQLLAEIQRLNDDPEVDGILVQLPVPKHINEDRVIEAISAEKDVDGFHPINVGRMSIGLPCFVSATPAGILELLKRYHIETQGKHCVVLGLSLIHISEPTRPY